jgi:hypothetical protein
MIPEIDFSQSSDSKRPESPEIAVICDISEWCHTWNVTKLLFASSTVGSKWHEYWHWEYWCDVIFLNMFVTDNFYGYVCEQTKLYASQVNSAAPCPFTKHSLFSDIRSNNGART